MTTDLFKAALTVLTLFLCGCGRTEQPAAAKEPWSEGFWLWNRDAAMPVPRPVDALYFQPFGEHALPQAREYWATFRYGGYQGLPDDAFLKQVLRDLQQLPVHTRGVQFDVDSPTKSLREYAQFLKRAREVLPKGQEISITSLLDWFRDGTAIDEVVEQVDEFVPQFYDVGDAYRGEGIAMKIDAAKWAPRFQKFGKRFRIGISTFGRGRLPFSAKLYRVITPLDIGNDPKYTLSTEHNSAGELVLNYDAPKEERVQFVVPTPESVHAAVASAKEMGASGVVYFRWPNVDESLVRPVDEVLGGVPLPVSVEAKRGDCVAVACYDVLLLNASRFSERELEYRIRSSADIDYTVPNGSGVRLVSPRELRVKIPPYAAQPRHSLGRVITADAATFTLEAQ